MHLSDLLHDISVERIWDEFKKAIVSSGFCETFAIYHDVLSVIFSDMGFDKVNLKVFLDIYGYLYYIQ